MVRVTGESAAAAVLDAVAAEPKSALCIADAKATAGAAATAVTAETAAAEHVTLRQTTEGGKGEEKTGKEGGTSTAGIVGAVPIMVCDVRGARGSKLDHTGKRVRASVIRGLVSVLTPWEHSRRSQRAGLLVLGNILGNVLEAAEGEGGGDVGRDDARLLVSQCAVELENGLTATASAGAGDGSDGEVDAPECDRRVRSAKQHFFVHREYRQQNNIFSTECCAYKARRVSKRTVWLRSG